jgi:rRNA maturation endonuclease Nob1
MSLPILSDRTNDWNNWYMCENCSCQEILRDHLFCPSCGQSLDWSKVVEQEAVQV